MSYSIYLPQPSCSNNVSPAKEPITGGGSVGPDMADSVLCGCWSNTYNDTQGIKRFEIKPGHIKDKQQDHLILTLYSAQEISLKNWGEAVITNLYEDDIKKEGFDAFIALYQFDDFDVRLQANMNLGLLIVTALYIFKDKSARMSYFSREYFRRQD